MEETSGEAQELGKSQDLSGLVTVDPCEPHGCSHKRSEGSIMVQI